jgi:hypothetical protein
VNKETGKVTASGAESKSKRRWIFYRQSSRYERHLGIIPAGLTENAGSIPKPLTRSRRYRFWKTGVFSLIDGRNSGQCLTKKDCRIEFRPYQWLFRSGKKRSACIGKTKKSKGAEKIMALNSFLALILNKSQPVTMLLLRSTLVFTPFVICEI